jgi:DNA-directed RNA polymerase specialized sigma24 family protein
MAPNVHQQLLRIVQGQQDAAAWLYDTFAPKLFRRLSIRYGYPGGLDAEDLLQDAFIFFLQNDCRVLNNFLNRNTESHQTQPALERYLWDLACGVATNKRRSSSLRKVVPLHPGDPDPVEPSAERKTVDRDQLEQLDRCLAGGNARVYLYFKLRYYDGQSPEEISQITQWSRKATYKLRQALNEALQRCVDSLELSPT